jgi:polar amino acid transport system substrate-binding protein
MKKTIRLIAITMLLIITVAGCGKKESAGTDTSLEDIKAKGKLVLGLDDEFPPMGFKNENQEIVGFDIDVAKEVCKRMGVELVIQPISWEAKELELSTKNIDCIWNGMTYNKERAKAMTLSKPYMKNTQVAVVLADSDVNSLKDLAGKTVAIQNGSTASDAIEANPEFKDSLKELVKVDNNVQALLDLKVSGSDAVVMDEVVARYYAEKEPGTYKILNETMSDEEYVIGFRKGEESLCNEVEKYLKEMKDDGTLAKISETWFGKDLTTVE